MGAVTSRALILHDGDAVDLIALTPLLRALAQRSGRACLLASSCPQAAMLLAAWEAVEPVLPLPRLGWTGGFARADRQLVAAMRPVAAGDVCYVLQPRLERLAVRLGYAAEARVMPPSPGPAEHRSLWALRVAGQTPAAARGWRPLPDEALDPRPLLPIPTRPEPGPLLLVTGEAGWGAERWSALAGMLGGDLRAIGAAAARQATGVAIRAVEPSPALLAGCAGCIGEDDWPTHAAAAYGRPTVLLPVRRDPRLWRPLVPNLELVSPLPPAQVPDGEEAWRRLCRGEGISPRMVMAAYGRLRAGR